MAVLKQIKFGNSVNRIAYTEVAIKSDSQNALSVVGTNTGLEDANPLYTIALAVDGKTITKTGNDGLATALALKVEAASGEGSTAKKARIALVDSNGGSNYAELSSVNIEDIVGSGVISSTSYDETTGILTITWAGGSTTSVNLGKLLDIDDIVLANGSEHYLSFEIKNAETGQAELGVKLAGVTYTAKSGSTEANLSVDTTNGSLLDAEETITAVKSYVDNVLKNASAELAVTAQGDNYINAAQDAQDNKKINVSADVQPLTANAGTRGNWEVTDPGDGSAATKALTGETAASISGVAQSLADSSDIATKVATYVEGAIAAEAARADAEVDRAIKSLDVADTAVAGQYVSKVDETDGVVSVTHANVSDAVLNGYTKGSDATAIAATDSLKAALSKLENQVDKAKAAATTKVVEGTDAGNNLEIVPTKSDTDGSTTYTINLTDVASKAALDTEIAARKAVDGQNGDTYAANGSANYISGATSLNDADVKLDAALKAEVTRAKNAEAAIDAAIGLTKAADPSETRSFTPTANYGSGSATVMANMQALDTQLKTVSDKLAAVQYKVTGTTLEFFGISEKTGA